MRKSHKTAIYIEDGIVQLVITPESEFGKKAISTFTNKPMQAKLFEGSFYDCRGGWVRQNNYPTRALYGNDWDNKDKSLILVSREETTQTTSENNSN